ncbi:MAG: hypothetical protein QNL04_01040, partial [SAR324 cluster bacterium]|nr:hypothetical protein [SAR324 cluster bacterium]
SKSQRIQIQKRVCQEFGDLHAETIYLMFPQMVFLYGRAEEHNGKVNLYHPAISLWIASHKQIATYHKYNPHVAAKQFATNWVTTNDKGELVMHPDRIPPEVVKHGASLPCVQHKLKLEAENAASQGQPNEDEKQNTDQEKESKTAEPAINPEDYYIVGSGFMPKPNLVPVVIAARRKYGVTLSLNEILELNKPQTTALKAGDKINLGVAMGKTKSAKLEAYVTKYLSGARWHGEKLPKTGLESLKGNFKTNFTAFERWLKLNGSFDGASRFTLRPPERAWLMHHSWRIAGQKRVKALEFTYPHFPEDEHGLGIIWDHGDAATSKQKAQEMVEKYAITYEPALKSLHTLGLAVDFKIETLSPEPLLTLTQVTTEQGKKFFTNLKKDGPKFGLLLEPSLASKNLYLNDIPFEIIDLDPKNPKVKFLLRGNLSGPRSIAYNRDLITLAKYFFAVHKLKDPEQKDFVHWSDNGH